MMKDGTPAVDQLIGKLQQMAPVNLKEPGGPAEWQLREEKGFLLGINHHTGEWWNINEKRKLTPEERAQAEAPHGAGPIDKDAPDRQHTDVYADMRLGNGAGMLAIRPGGPLGANPGFGLSGGAASAMNTGANTQLENSMLHQETRSGPGASTTPQYADMPVNPETPQLAAAPWDAPAPGQPVVTVGDQGSDQAAAASLRPAWKPGYATPEPMTDEQAATNAAAAAKPAPSPQQISDYSGAAAKLPPPPPPPISLEHADKLHASGHISTQLRDQIASDWLKAGSAPGPGSPGFRSEPTDPHAVRNIASGAALTPHDYVEAATLKGRTANETGRNILAMEQGNAQQGLAADVNATDAIAKAKIEQNNILTQGTNDALQQSQHDAQLAAQELAKKSGENDLWHAQYQRRVSDALNAKIDPNRLWHSMDAGHSVMAGIGMALGAFGGAVNGGKNMAVDEINKGIDRDVHAQMEDKRNTLEALKISGTGHEQYQHASLQMSAQASQLRAEKTSTAIAVAQNMAQRAGNPAVQAQADQLTAHLQVQLRDNNLQTARYDLATQRAHEQAAAAAAWAEAQKTAKYGHRGTPGRNLVETQGTEGYTAAQKRIDEEQHVEGGIAIKGAPSGEKAGAEDKDKQNRLLAIDDTLGTLDKIEEIRRRHEGGTNRVTNPSDVGTAASLGAGARQGLVKSFTDSNRAPSEAEQRQLTMMIPEDPTEYGWSADARIRAAREKLESERERLGGKPRARVGSDRDVK